MLAELNQSGVDMLILLKTQLQLCDKLTGHFNVNLCHQDDILQFNPIYIKFDPDIIKIAPVLLIYHNLMM